MSKNGTDENLFKEECEALESAFADTLNEIYQDNQLLHRYEWLTGRYSKLLKLTRKIFRISDSQGRTLHRQQNEIQNLLDNANQGFLTFGLDFKVNRQYSGECVRIFGKKIAGLSILELMNEKGKIDIGVWSEVFTTVFSSAETKGDAVLAQFSPIIKVDDKDIRIECKLISQENDKEGERALIMMILTDITEKRKTEEQIQYLSYHDKLTSLYNRAYIDLVLPDLEKPELFPLSVIIIDVNGLKLVNDVFGHAQGDRFLILLAQVLQQSCRQTDIIARWGGDEFLILLPRANASICERICADIRLGCSKEVTHSIPLSAAVGTATKEKHTTTSTELFSVAENQMYANKLGERQQFRQNVIDEMEKKLDVHCFESPGHRERVRIRGKDFAAFLGFELDSGDMKPLDLLSRLHDIGKVVIPRDMLGKSGYLAESEWEVIKGHSDVGYRMAQSIGELALAEIILSLHEHFDGSGYPRGLIGEKIPFLARLFSLVDVYDILTHPRPYGRIMSETEALREIAASSGSQFDPDLTAKFLEYMKWEQNKLEG